MGPITKTKTKLTKKNGYARSKFLLCIRPPVVDKINIKKNVDVGSVRGCCTDGSSEPLFTYLAMAEKKGVVFPRIFPVAAGSLSANDDDESNYNMKDENGVQIENMKKKMQKKKKKKKKKGSGARLLGLLKAIFFETALVKRIKKRKLKQKNCQSNGHENSLHNKEFPSEVEDGKIPGNTSSSLQSSSLFISSSASSSSLPSNCKSFRLNKLERKHKQDNVDGQGKGSFGPDTGLCFILISVLILITWSKIWAIFCISTWFFIVPRRKKSATNSPENVGTDYFRLDSDESKRINRHGRTN